MKALIHCLGKILPCLFFFIGLHAQETNQTFDFPKETEVKEQPNSLENPQQDQIGAILKGTKNPHIIIETTAGMMEFELFLQAAPKAVENFLRLADKGYYDGVSFHRIIKGFMIQGGDPTGSGRGGDSIWGGAFEDEIALGYAFDRGGLLAMANAGPNTNKSQFFITTARASWLNGRHTIFGELKGGFDVLSALESVKTDNDSRPLEMQRIIRMRIIP